MKTLTLKRANIELSKKGGTTLWGDIKGTLDNQADLKTALDEKQPKGNYLTAIPDNYVTDEKLNQKGYLTAVPEEYVTETELAESGFMTELPANVVTDEKLSQQGFLKEIPTEYVTETELSEHGYLTEIPAEYVTETELSQKGYTTIGEVQAEGYLKEVPEEYVTDTELTQKDYATNTSVDEKIAKIPSGGSSTRVIKQLSKIPDWETKELGELPEYFYGDTSITLSQANIDKNFGFTDPLATNFQIYMIDACKIDLASLDHILTNARERGAICDIIAEDGTNFTFKKLNGKIIVTSSFSFSEYGSNLNSPETIVFDKDLPLTEGNAWINPEYTANGITLKFEDGRFALQIAEGAIFRINFMPMLVKNTSITFTLATGNYHVYPEVFSPSGNYRLKIVREEKKSNFMTYKFSNFGAYTEDMTQPVGYDARTGKLFTKAGGGAAYDDTQVKADIKSNTDKITALETEVLGASTTVQEINTIIG